MSEQRTTDEQLAEHIPQPRSAGRVGSRVAESKDPRTTAGGARMAEIDRTSKTDNVVKLANQEELAKARATVSAVLVPDLPAEIIARAFMRLQCADVPREPWHWEVCQILQTPQVPDETPECPHCRAVYEVWAGSDGMVPETAPEAYQERLIHQMRDAAKRGLAPKAAALHASEELPRHLHHQPGVQRQASDEDIPGPDGRQFRSAGSR